LSGGGAIKVPLGEVLDAAGLLVEGLEDEVVSENFLDGT
jgi:hypothetical protein